MRKLVDTFELAPFELPKDEPLRFRVEIFSSECEKVFSARVLRWESMRLNPSFSSAGGNGTLLVADYNVLVEDGAINSDEMSGASPAEVLEAVMGRLRQVFGKE